MKGTTIHLELSPEEKADIKIIKADVAALRNDFQPKEPTVFLTRNQVKELLNVDLSTVHNWTKRGKLKAYGLGNRIYYKRNEVEAAIQPINH